MSIADLNAFCRKYDLIYVEEGTHNGTPVYWFLDFQNNRRFYSAEEIHNKMGVLV